MEKKDHLSKSDGVVVVTKAESESESDTDGSKSHQVTPELSWMSEASDLSVFHRRPSSSYASIESHHDNRGGIRQGTSTLRSVTVSRLMGPSDSNVYGNVHGGVILKMIDEAGAIMASRYCNTAPNRMLNQEPGVAALARIEHMDFLLPMHINEVAELSAEIVYTHTHCMLVLVKVWAENIITGEKRLTNKARLWYIPLDIKSADKVLMVPLMQYLSKVAEEWGYEQYRRQKADRKAKLAQELQAPIHAMGAPSEAEQHTVSASQTCLSVIIGINDVTFSGHCQGGVLLKLMDECAGTTCCKHCRSICVTACIEATNFHKKIPKGALIYVHSWLTFTSRRSMEVEVVVEFETRWANPHGNKKEKAVDAFFTFVALDTTTGKAMEVPPLKLVTEDEQTRFTQGEARYHRMKRQRVLDHQHSCEMALLEEKHSITNLKGCGCSTNSNTVAPIKEATGLSDKVDISEKSTSSKDTSEDMVIIVKGKNIYAEEKESKGTAESKSNAVKDTDISASSDEIVLDKSTTSKNTVEEKRTAFKTLKGKDNTPKIPAAKDTAGKKSSSKDAAQGKSSTPRDTEESTAEKTGTASRTAPVSMPHSTHPATETLSPQNVGHLLPSPPKTSPPKYSPPRPIKGLRSDPLSKDSLSSSLSKTPPKMPADCLEKSPKQ